MKWMSLLASAGILAAGIAATVAVIRAQGPMYDKVTVDLPYRVTVKDTVLEPGHYVIRQLDDPGGGSRVVQIFSDDGMKLQTSVLTIPALDNNTPENTKVVLHHFGDDYYFDKIWVQGKNYGYEFPVPDSVKSRTNERTEPYTVAATYQPTKPPEPVANNTPPPPPPAAEPETAPAPAPAPPPTEIAQNAPPPPPARAPASAPEPAPAPERMPTTSIGWVTLMISGSLLSGAGLLLRRVRV